MTHARRSDAVPGFSLDRFTLLAQISRENFWFAGRRELVMQMLGRTLHAEVGLAADIGCGPGIWLDDWRTHAGRVVGIDPFAQSAPRDRIPDEISLRPGMAEDLPFATGEVDLAVALDMLEHVPDIPALAEIARVLKPGGTLLVTVPAGPWLWSRRDEAAGHLRRYTRSDLRQKVESAGFEILECRYYLSLLLPIVMLSRLLGRRSTAWRDREDRVPGRLNAIFRAITLFEVERGLRLPFGSSLALVARRC